jgi:hypothetical protein
VVSRVTSFSDGSVLFASDLNSEFNNLVNNINSLDNDNLSTSANIAASKISASIAGSGIGRNGSTGTLSVNVDNSTVEISGNNVIVKANGISNSQIRQGVATSVIGRSANSTGNVADIAATTNGTVLKREGDALVFDTVDTADITAAAVTTAKIADGNVTQAKRAALGQQVSASCGTFFTTSAFFVNVTNLSVTITTTGRPVWVGLMSDGGGAGSSIYAESSIYQAFMRTRFLRSGTEVAQFALIIQQGGSGSIVTNTYVPSSSANHIDVVGAGTYTYTVQIRADTASTTAGLANAKLIAYEL